MCEQGKFPLHLRPSLGQMGKQFHAGAVKPEPGLCGSGFGFFKSVRCPIRWTKVTDALGTRLVAAVLWLLPQAVQYKISNRFTVEHRFGFDVLVVLQDLVLLRGLFTHCHSALLAISQ